MAVNSSGFIRIRQLAGFTNDYLALDELRQIDRQEPKVPVLSQILRIQQVFETDMLGELLAEFVHGNVCLVSRGLDLDRGIPFPHKV